MLRDGTVGRVFTGSLLRRGLELTVVLVCAASCVEGLHEPSLVGVKLSEEIGVKLDLPVPATMGGLCEPAHGFLRGPWL